MTRRRFKEWEVVATLIEQGIVIPCFRCKLPLPLPTKRNMVQREHIHEVGLEGPDIPANCRFSHYDCHSIITNGTKATSAGSSKHKKAHADRLAENPVQKGGPTAYCSNCGTEYDPESRHTCIPKPRPMAMRCRRCGDDYQDGVCPRCGPPLSRPFQKRQAVRT